MIKGITQSGRYISVSGGSSSGPYINPGSAGAGMVRWNPNMNQLEVNDGSVWQAMSNSFTSIGLTSEAEVLLDWAREKRNEEMAWKSLAEKNQAVKLALDNLEEARRQLTITAKLSKDYEQTTN